MRPFLIALSLISLSGCATWAHYQMQPDQSYLIEATGQNWASHAKVKRTALEAAGNLCPDGYATRTQFGEDTMQYTMIVTCRTKPKASSKE